MLIVRTEPQAAQQGIDGLVEIPHVYAEPAEREIAEREIRAEIDGALRLRQRLLVLPPLHIQERQRVVRVGVAVVERHGSRRLRMAGGRIALDVGAPSPPDPVVQHAGERHVARAELRIDLDRPPEPGLGLPVLLGIAQMVEMPHPAHPAIEGVEVAGALARRPPPLDELHLGLHGGHHALRDLVLQGEDIRQVAIEPFQLQIPIGNG